MPPTIQTGQNSSDKKQAKPAKQSEKRSDLICKVKYNNTLPDIPFDLKFIAYPFDSSRFVQYNTTSLEKNYRYEVLTEPDLGVNIDLINRDIYAADPNAQLHPDDEKLLEEDNLMPQNSKRSRHHARNVSWLRRTEYISTEQTRFQPQTMDKVEAKVGYSIKKTLANETLYMDRDSQIKAIKKTFDDAKVPIEKHYSKPNVHPVEILPVFPDFKTWKFPCAQVIFDSDPAPVGKQVPAQIEEMSQAMIRGVMDESGEQFVAYFLPDEETVVKRREDAAKGVDYTEDEVYEYKLAREYNWNVKSKACKGYEENYFLVVRPDAGVFYNELETRVRLSKRRQKVGQAQSNTRLIVRHRPMDSVEFHNQRFREKQLEAPNDDEEDLEIGVENTEKDQAQINGDAVDRREDDANQDKDEENESNDEGKSSENESKSSSRSGSRSRSCSRGSTASESSRSGSRSSVKVKSRSSSRSSSKSSSGSPTSSRSRSKSRSSSKSRSQTRSPSKSRSGSSKSSSESESASESH